MKTKKTNRFPNILIVDDDLLNIQLIEENLSDIDKINLFSSTSGIEAVEICKQNEMAILLMDLMMPEMDGYEVLEKIRQTEKNKETPAIIISGASFEENDLSLESIEKGAIDFIPKPFNPDILVGKVKHFIDIFQQRKEKERLIEKLEYYNYKVRESQVLLTKITSVANDAIMVIDHLGRITFWNDSANKLFGYSKSEITNNDFKILLGEEIETKKFADYIEKYLRNKESHPNIVGTKEITVQRKNGLKIPAEVSISSFHNKDQINIVCIVRDITERIKAHNEILKAKEIKEANKIMREFMDNVSHELRTPMNAIIGISKMILKYNSSNLTDKQKEGIELISNSGRRLLDLINDILDLSRLESKKTTVINDSFSIQKLISGIKSTAIGLIDAKDIKFVTRKSNSVPENIITDYKKLTQILINIVGNAIKFTEQGKIELGIHVSEDKLFFEVSDTGIGMTEAETKVIFDKFRRIESSATKKFKGTGLGLAITKKMIELLKGEIFVKSNLNEGTVMTFYIPFVPDEIKNEESEKNEVKEVVKISNNSKVKIVLVEDDENLCYLLTNYLKIDGKNVLSFNDGLEGYKAIEDEEPELVVIDLELPTMTGYDIMRKLEKHYPNKYPVLVISGSNYIPKKEKYIYNEILIKPIQENVFIKSVNNILEKKKRKIKILIAEDEEIGIYTYRLMLEEKYKLLFAKNGLEAIKINEEQNPDLILMDIMMPKMDGIASFKEIRKNYNTKIIAATARAGESDRKRLLDFGFNDFISKPINEEELINKINKLIN